MASSNHVSDKTVTGYPARPSQVAAGYPAGAFGAYSYAVQLPSTDSYVHRPMGQRAHTRPPPYNGRNLLRRLIIICVAISSIVALFYFFGWLILRPRLPEFRVESADVFPFTANGSDLNATWDFTLLVANSNCKLSVYYDRIQAAVFYGEDLQLAFASLPPFFQEKKNETLVQFRLDSVDEYVGEDTVNRITKERNGGSVNFGVKMIAWIRFRIGIWRMREHLLRINCDQIPLGFYQNKTTGSLMGQSRSCEVTL